MVSPEWKLSVLALPQFWHEAARRIDVRAVLLPRGNPLEPLLSGLPPTPDQPAFVDADLTLEIHFIPGLEQMPDPANVQVSQAAIPALTPPDLRELYDELALRFPLAPPDSLPDAMPRRNNTRIRKYLPVSYRTAFPFGSPRSTNAITDDSFRCALHTPAGPIVPSPPSPGMRWGQVLAGVLSQPRLAERLGLIYRLSLTLPGDISVALGGWLYVSFRAATPYSSLLAPSSLSPEPNIKLYAARIPPLQRARTLFASVLFPIPAPGVSFDENILEAQTWDDGFAKIVHCAQPRHGDLLDNSTDPTAPVQDAGIQLGWDDEQLVIWFNRQADPDALNESRDSPLGVHGYRVDVRRANTESWTSLARVEGDLKLGTFNEHFVGEHALRVAPLQLDGLRTGDFWMPSYFARWNGKSLCVGDDFARKLNSNAAPLPTWKPVGVDDVPLRYGETYQFRVRLADLSGGGPAVDQEPIHPAEAPMATCQFRRFVPPKAVRVKEITPLDPDEPQLRYEIRRPVLGYPSLVYTGFPNAEQGLIADAALAQVEGREVGLPDPDVATLEIEVAVADPALSEELAYRSLYTTAREFPRDGGSFLNLEVAFQDSKDPTDFRVASNTGPLPLPTARDLRLRLVALCRPDPDLLYFGSEETLRSAPLFIKTRAHSQNERGLFAERLPPEQFRACMLQPDSAPNGHLTAAQAADGRQDEAPTDVAQRLANAVDLNVNGLRFFGKPDQRTIFGCSGALRHVLSPGNGAITFGAKNELSGRWIAVVSLILARDWTWDALADRSFEVTRQVKRLLTGQNETEVVGVLDLRRSVHHVARQSGDRKNTRLVFFDAIDPKPAVGEFPSELELTYTLEPKWKRDPIEQDAPFSVSLRLPMATAPAQTPNLLSAGIGLSPYIRAADYSSSEPRRRELWLEFAEPVSDKRDALFARVLAYAPDPMLTGGRPAPPPTPSEPPLPIPSESIRSITPGHTPDQAGLDAMQKLIESDSPRHFYLPLPPGLSHESPEMFGFFTYEVRVGHFVGWTTAHGRFGAPLRVTGIQHPAPPLSCRAARRSTEVFINAGYATPVFEGRNLLPRYPKTEIWGLLYTQVAQIDGQDQRNVLLGRRLLEPLLPPTDQRETLDTVGTARWEQQEIDPQLEALGLPRNALLSVLTVELLPEFARKPDPLGADLGSVRILRTSPLIKVPEVCL
jgi:hypothetical protein